MDRRPLKWAGWIFGSIGLLLGALFVSLALVAGHAEQGKPTTTGTVVDRYVTETRYQTDDGTWEDSSTTWVVIEYVVDGETYRIRQSFPRQVGDTVTVVYDPARPQEGEVAGSAGLTFWLLAGTLGLPFFLIGMGLWVWGRSYGSYWSPKSSATLDRSWRWGANPMAAERDKPATPRRTSQPADEEFPAYPGRSVDSPTQSDTDDLR